MLVTLGRKLSTDELGVKQQRHRRYSFGATLFWSASSPAEHWLLVGKVSPPNYFGIYF